jgi:hypothetical protein
MHLTGFDRFTWAAAFYGHLLLLFVIFARGRAKAFPFFTAYIAENIVKTAALYLILNHLSFDAYSGAYLFFATADEVLQLLVFYELAVHVFCPTGVWASDVRKTFVGLICASVLVALALTWLSAPHTSSATQTFILRANFLSAALMSELFVGMVALSATAGLPWKTHVARIAQGLGAYSLVCVAKDIAVNYIGLGQDTHVIAELNHLRVLTYLVCETFWIVMLWQEAPAPRELPEAMRVQIYTLQRQVEYDLVRIRGWRKN